MKINLRKALHVFALLGRPIMRIFGVKKGSVADKAAEAAEVADKVLPKDGDKPSSPKP